MTELRPYKTPRSVNRLSGPSSVACLRGRDRLGCEAGTMARSSANWETRRLTSSALAAASSAAPSARASASATWPSALARTLSRLGSVARRERLGNLSTRPFEVGLVGLFEPGESTCCPELRVHEHPVARPGLSGRQAVEGSSARGSCQQRRARGSSVADQDLPASLETNASPGVPYQVSPPTTRHNLAEHVGAPSCQLDSAY
jgi:hypothetical protein